MHPLIQLKAGLLLMADILNAGLAVNQTAFTRDDKFTFTCEWELIICRIYLLSVNDVVPHLTV